MRDDLAGESSLPVAVDPQQAHEFLTPRPLGGVVSREEALQDLLHLVSGSLRPGRNKVGPQEMDRDRIGFDGEGPAVVFAPVLAVALVFDEVHSHFITVHSAAICPAKMAVSAHNTWLKRRKNRF